MMNQSADIAHDANLAAAVVDSVGVVLLSEGFRAVRVTAQTASFHSSIAEIEVYYEPYSFELGLDLRWMMYPDRSFSLSELLRLWKHPEADTYRNFIAADRSAMAAGLQRLAQLLADLYLLGMHFDETARNALQCQQAGIAEKMAIDSRNRRARAIASTAWARKDFPKLVTALQEIQGDLTEVELRQLSYGKSKAEKGGGG